MDVEHLTHASLWTYTVPLIPFGSKLIAMDWNGKQNIKSLKKIDTLKFFHSISRRSVC